MVGWKREQGLSEVIGFLMIVALLGILFSMYLLYVVPIQGKDAEIAHMKYVTQQFIDVKSDIDSLVINDRVNVPIARSFELGTLSSSGQGSLSIVPIQSFLEAAGTLVVNEQMDNMTIGGRFRTYDPPSFFNDIMDPSLNTQPRLFNDRNHLYAYYYYNGSGTDPFIGNLTINETDGTFRIRPVTRYILNETEEEGDWIINTSNLPENQKNLTIQKIDDIVLEIFNSTADYSNLEYQKTLLENVSSYSGHLFDLYDGNEITWADSDFLNYTRTLGYDPGPMINSTMEPVTQTPHYLGSLQYWSQNRYWINQELLYEMGGLFLKQNEGVSIMLIPSLAVTPDTTKDPTNIEVSLVDIYISDTNDVSGSKSAQIFAKVDSIWKNQLNVGTDSDPVPKYLTPEEMNADYLIIQFTPDADGDRNRRVSTTKLWKRAFDQVKVVTMKTMSERSIVGYPADEAIKTYYIDDISAAPGQDLFASMVIGNVGGDGLKNVMADSYATIGDFQDDIDALETLAETTNDVYPFTFDYTKARVSLVMQSGAL